jgi:hypothetical protein
MDKQTFRLVTPQARQNAVTAVTGAPDGYHVTITPPTRSLDANAKLHAMLNDIREHVEEMSCYKMDDIKLIFMHDFRSEMRFLPKLSGQGSFPVGQRTSTLTKEQFAGLIELVYKFGSERGVSWSEHNPWENER